MMQFESLNYIVYLVMYLQNIYFKITTETRKQKSSANPNVTFGAVIKRVVYRMVNNVCKSIVWK